MEKFTAVDHFIDEDGEGVIIAGRPFGTSSPVVPCGRCTANLVISLAKKDISPENAGEVSHTPPSCDEIKGMRRVNDVVVIPPPDLDE